MRITTQRLTILGICFWLTGCAGLHELQDTDIQGEGFLPQLARAYKEFSQQEADQYDWIDADYFARKGLIAHEGHYPAPEDPRRWSIAKEQAEPLRQARERLVRTLTLDVQTNHPGDAAKAQALYDCWVEQQEEGWQPDDINACRTAYETHMAALDATLLAEQNNKEEANGAPAVPEPVIPFAEPVQRRFTVLFPFNSSKVGKQHQDMLDDVAFIAHGLKNLIVRLTGHTDRSGSESHNLELSRKRAASVEKEFTRRGVEPSQTVIEGKGESEPAVPTQDGVREPKNRRVEIEIEGESK